MVSTQKLENETEEALLQRIARIQAMLDEEEEADSDVVAIHSSDEENNVPRKNDRTRHGSPFPAVRSVSQKSEDSEENNESDDYSRFGSQPFYCLPSTSKGYSESLARVNEGKTEQSSRKRSKNRDRNPDEKTEKEEDVWVPLTFLEQKASRANSNQSPVLTYRPKVPDLSRKSIMAQSVREKSWKCEEEWDFPREANSSSQKKLYFADIAEKRRIKRNKKKKRAAKKMNEDSQIVKEEVMEETKLDRKRKAEESNEAVNKMRKLISGIKQEDLSEDVKPDVQALASLGQNFNACVSIAANLPDDALLPFRFLQFPVNIKTENQSELLSEIQIKTERSSPEPREEIESNQDFSKAIHNLLPQEIKEEGSRPETLENSKPTKVDFSRELQRFSKKLKMMKGGEKP